MRWLVVATFVIHIVLPGETLAGIVGNQWPHVCQINHLANCNLIYPGQELLIPGNLHINLTNMGYGKRIELSGRLGCMGLEKLWESAGGNHESAFIAAEIAMAESGGNQYATGPAGERGYWQINPDHGSLSTYDPYGNARAAVLISDDGRNWSPWTTYTHGLYVGRC